ncbi:MAG: hypothetical protein V8T62_01320 [Oscillospiraceae bacterium]
MARCYLARSSDLLDGGIIVGTGGPNPGAKAGKLLAQCLCRIGKGKEPGPASAKAGVGQL